MTRALSGYTALITGGTRGIGAAIAQRLAEAGAKIYVTGTKKQAEQVLPKDYHYMSVDFSDRAQSEAFAAQVAGLGVDILINNAGVNKISPFEKIDLADFDRIQEVNVRAPMLLCRAVLPKMRQKGWGRIVNISSIFGQVTKEFRASYSSSKFALDGMTAALAVEVAGDGVLANCVAPGFIDTELTRNVLGEAGMTQLAAQVPMRRMGRPEEIASFVAWLAGPENTFLTGQNIAVDGGFTRV